MTMKPALRIAVEAAMLPVEERDLVIDAVLGMDGCFERALADCTAELPGRPLAEVVEAIEAGDPLAPGEVALIARVAALIPTSTIDRRAERDGLIRKLAKQFGPRGGSVNARANWLRSAYDRFVAGADWKADGKFATMSPYADPMRAMLWRVAKIGPLPRDRALREIIAS
jgi:hypothetical protein